jgi:hypothetical protein
MRIKLFSTLSLFFLSFVLFARSADASFVSLEKDGNIRVNVLAEEDSVHAEIPNSTSVEVKEVLNENADAKSKISLKRNGSEVELNIYGNDGEQSYDVTGYGDSIVEIEERPQSRKVSILALDDGFSILHGGVSAKTEYEIEVDPETAGLSLKTPSGFRFLSILPKTASESVLRTRIINSLSKSGSLDIVELADRELAYVVRGQKLVNIFNVYDYALPVTAKISATTGEMISIDEPAWLKVFSFLFV